MGAKNKNINFCWYFYFFEIFKLNIYLTYGSGEIIGVYLDGLNGIIGAC